MRRNTEGLYTPGCIRTYTGIYFDVMNPTEDMVDIRDIAHSLAQQPRFGGHLPVFYSVAEHCVATARSDLRYFNLEVLLHDATEAYLLDLPKPIKDLIPEYKMMEDRIARVIASKFGLTYPFEEHVHSADREALEWEWNRIMISQEPYRGWSSNRAENEFLATFKQITQPAKTMNS